MNGDFLLALDELFQAMNKLRPETVFNKVETLTHFLACLPARDVQYVLPGIIRHRTRERSPRAKQNIMDWQN